MTPDSRHQVLFEYANKAHLEGNHREALSTFAKILADNPYYPNVWSHAGNVAKDMGRDEEALYLYRHAVKMSDRSYAEWPGIKFNLANALRNLGCFEEAAEHAEQAAEADPYDTGISMGAFQSFLQRGDFAKGWRYYGKRRIDKDNSPRGIAMPWYGQELPPQQRLIVWNEQGMGEQIMFASMFEEVQRRAPGTVILADDRLVPIFKRSFPGLPVYAQLTVSAEDTHVPIGNLGGIFRPNLESFPGKAFLKADPLRAAVLRAKYTGGPRTRTVGVSWRSERSAIAMDKSFPLVDLAPVFAVPGCNFVSLQYGDTDVAEATARQEGFPLVFDRTVRPSEDLDAAAAQIDAMDVVITNSSAAAHLAGALGKETWVVLPFAKGLLWHWFLEREDSPWYPKVRLFRARKGEAWPEVLQRVADALDDTGRQA